MSPQTYMTSPRCVAPLIKFPKIHTQDFEDIVKNSGKGIFVGSMHFLPYFLNFDVLMNPHVFICGITGSGKTYLMKNLMLKFCTIMDSLIIVIDFTGEYRSFVELAGEESILPENLINAVERKNNGIVHVNLSVIKGESNRLRFADEALGKIVENMRGLEKNRMRRVFIMLDEAWKLLRESKSLETILREGRKYMHGLIFSSQLVEDIDLATLSNAATLFVFRLQNKQSLERLAKNYNMRGDEIEKIQNLNVGSCVVVQTNAFNKRNIFFIEKVKGIELEKFLKIQTGDLMEIEVPRRKFEETIRGVCDVAHASKIVREAEEKGYIELSELVKELVGNGSNRRRVLSSLRNLGIKDSEIADSFAIAVSSLVDTDETKR